MIGTASAKLGRESDTVLHCSYTIVHFLSILCTFGEAMANFPLDEPRGKAQK